MSKRLTGIAAASLLIATAALASVSSLAAPMHEVEVIRGAKFRHDVVHKTIDRAELPARLREQLTKSLPYPPDEMVTVFKALQLVEPDTKDVMTKLLDMYQQQVLAFYDPETHVYYSLQQQPDATRGLVDPALLESTVQVHELTHALQDQLFDAGARDEKLKDDTDAAMAYHALLEGEATLVMMADLLGQAGKKLDDVIDNDMLTSALAQGAASDSTMPAGTPKYFAESLKFPYLEGMKFVIEAYRRGGWKMLDRVHANPPKSTREIYHPADYFARLGGKPVVASPEFKDGDRKKANVLTVEHLGEFHWRYLVGDDASRGWVDDHVVITKDPKGGHPRVAAETKWENADRASAFRTAYVAFLKKRGLEPKAGGDGNVVRVEYVAQ